MLRSILRVGCILMIVLFWSDQSFALPRPNWFITEEYPYRITIKDKQIYETDVEDMTGDISINQSEFNVTEEFKINRLPMSFGVNFKHTEIDENTNVDMPSHLEGLSFLVGAKMPLPFVNSDYWFMGIDLIPSMYTDDGKFTTSAFRLPFRIYGIYKQNENWVFIAGVSVTPDFDRTILPIIGFIYKPNDRLSFNMASTEPNISFKLNDKATVLAEFGFSYDEYEVTRGNNEGVVLKYQEATAGLGFQYDFNQHAYVSVGSGFAFGRRLEYVDNVSEILPEAGVYSNIKVSFQF